MVSARLRHLGALALFLGTGLAGATEPAGASTPPRMRPCCALGADVEPRVGGVGMPVVLGNIADPASLGAHRYLSHSSLNEKSGILYTCRGGVIDIAHLRNAADWVGHLVPRLEKLLSEGEKLELSELTNRIRVRVRQSARSRPTIGRKEIVSSAVRLSYSLALYHEIVTWKGAASYDMFSEAFSAFSPEDLYSDALGAQLGGLAVSSRLPFDSAMDSLLQDALFELGAVPPKASREALARFDGRVLHSRVPVPEFRYLAKRNFDPGPRLVPWRLPEQGFAPAHETNGSLDACRASTGRVLQAPLSRDPLFAVEFEHKVKNGRTLWLTQEQLPVFARELRREAQVRYGKELVQWPPRDWATKKKAPRKRRSIASDFEAIRFFGLRAFGGVSQAIGKRIVGGHTITGGQGLTDGGDLAMMTYGSLVGDSSRGVIHHLAGIRGRNVMFCHDKGTGSLHPPIFAWFRNCQPRGWLGVGGLIGGFQHDTKTARTVIRPLTLHLNVNLLGNGHHENYLKRHLILFAGAGVDTLSQFSSTDLRSESELSLRGLGGVMLTLRSSSMGWEFKAHGTYRRDVTDFRDDWSFEAGARAGYRLFLRRLPAHEGPPWGAFFFGLHGGLTYFTKPIESYTDWIAPLASAEERLSHHALFVLEFNYDAYVF